MELLDSSPSPEPPRIGLVKQVILIGETQEGQQLLTIIEAQGKSPLDITVASQPGQEIPAPACTFFDTNKELYNWLGRLLTNKSYDLSSKKEPVEEKQKKFSKTYKEGEGE